MRLEESHGPGGRLDLPGVGLASAGMLGVVWALVNGNAHGWASAQIVAPLVAGLALLGAFAAWELRSPVPMLPLRFFRNRAFALGNVSSLFMFFGMFGSIFLLTQFFQTVQGYSPLQAGLRILPWTIAPMFIAPIAGALSDRISPPADPWRPGLSLQAAALAWIAQRLDADHTVRRAGDPVRPRRHRHGALLRSDGERRALGGAPGRGGPGLGREQRDPGARRRLRRRSARRGLFACYGGYETGAAFVDGMNAAVYVGAGVVALGALAAFLIPSGRVGSEAPVTADRPGERLVPQPEAA